MQISRHFGTHLLDTEQWRCQEHFGANIDFRRVCFSVKETRKNHRDSSPVNKMDCGAVAEFPFPGIPKPVYTCGHMHSHE